MAVWFGQVYQMNWDGRRLGGAFQFAAQDAYEARAKALCAREIIIAGRLINLSFTPVSCVEWDDGKAV